MTATLRRLLALAELPARARRARDRARRARGRLRRRADGDRRLPDLARGGAAADPRRSRSTIVAVRFFGARAAARALPRAARLARPRAAGARADPRARLRAHRAARAGGARRRSGAATCSAGWSATSTRCRASTCAGIGPPLVALVVAVAVRRRDGRRPARRRRRARARAARWRASPCPLSPARSRRRRRAPPGGRRGELTAELVELLRGAPELVAYGREEDALAASRAADRELVRLGRRDALVAGLADGLVDPRRRPDDRRRPRRGRRGARRGRRSTACSSRRSRCSRCRRSTRSRRCRRRRASSRRRSRRDAACSS